MDMAGYGWTWVDVGGYGWIRGDECGYGWIWVDLEGFGSCGHRRFAKLRRTSPSLRAEVRPPKKTSCQNLEPCSLQDMNLQDL